MTYIHIFSCYCKENNKLEAKISIFESSFYIIYLVSWNGTSSSEKWEWILLDSPVSHVSEEWEITLPAVSELTLCFLAYIYKSFVKKWGTGSPITFPAFSDRALEKNNYGFTAWLSMIFIDRHRNVYPFGRMEDPYVQWFCLFSLRDPQCLKQYLVRQKCSNICCWSNYVKAMCSNKHIRIQATATLPQQTCMAMDMSGVGDVMIWSMNLTQLNVSFYIHE